MEIRYLNKKDNIIDVCNIYEISWKKVYKGIIPDSYLENIKKEQWIKNFDIPNWKSIVAVLDNKIIGTSTFSASRIEKYPNSGEIISIYFLPEYMHMGYGKDLMDFSLNELKKENYQDAYLWVLEENKSAINFYEKYGFINSHDELISIIGGNELKELRYVYKF